MGVNKTSGCSGTRKYTLPGIGIADDADSDNDDDCDDDDDNDDDNDGA